MSADLPIHAVLPELLAALRAQSGAVLVAPPGAGKTTAVAPALLKEPWCTGTIILTSPRRVAARAAAERMAEMLGERAGETVGYLTRLDTKRSAATRVLVVTEGIFVNTILADPELAGVSALLFDEAHERHLDGDLGLALALEAQGALRPDLRVLVMSATIDGARFARLLGEGAPVIESAGRAHPLAIRWLGARPEARIEDAVTSAILAAWREEAGDILAFLPGVGEIARTAERLETHLPGVPVLPLHGQVEPAAQRTAIRRDQQGRRRIVLATAIAETSLTLDGVQVVVDSGLARRAEYDPAAGTSHLVTRAASRAASAQRAGRAARQGPGVAYRLWAEAGHGGRPEFDPPEMLTADLAPLTLALADWGASDLAALPWLDAPPAAAIAVARERLRGMGALDDGDRITAFGRKVAALPMAPAQAATLLAGAAAGAGHAAARLVLLLQERGLGGRAEDLAARLQRWDGDRGARAGSARKLAQGWARKAAQLAGPGTDAALPPPPGILLAAGLPEMVARRRDASGETWLAAGGRGYRLDPASSLARAEWLVIGDAQGSAQGARITAALALEEAEVIQHFGSRIETRRTLAWKGERVEARRERRLGAIVLSRGPDPEPDAAAIEALLLDKAVDNSADILPQTLMARAHHAGIAGLSRENLAATAGSWLAPLLAGRRDLALPAGRVAEALLGQLGWEERQRLDARAPRAFVSPTGSEHPIDYAHEGGPAAELRVQALFGLDRHPMVGDTPLLLRLTSPAGRPIQATRDLPGFWRGSWRDVVRDMKGRYPRHRWPDEPWTETPSLKTKRAFQAGHR